MFCLASFIRIYLYIGIYDTIGIQFSQIFIETDSICSLLKTLTLLETIMACFTLIYFLQYLDKNIIEPISSTIIESSRHIFVFLTSFVCCLFGFSFFTYFIYGTRSLSKYFFYFLEFKTLTDCILNTLFMIYGDFTTFKNLYDLFPLITPIFLVLFGTTVRKIIKIKISFLFYSIIGWLQW